MTNATHRWTEVMIDRQGLKLAAQLNLATAELAPDVSERLRAARERALAERKVERRQAAPAWVSQGQGAALTWGGDEGMGWVGWLSSALMLCVLVLGLAGIQEAHDDLRARELADVDVALLTDDLPPAAYADPGFIRFLQTDN